MREVSNQTTQATEKGIKNLKAEPNQCQTEANDSSPLANSSHPALIEEELKNLSKLRRET